MKHEANEEMTNEKPKRTRTRRTIAQRMALARELALREIGRLKDREQRALDAYNAAVAARKAAEDELGAPVDPESVQPVVETLAGCAVAV